MTDGSLLGDYNYNLPDNFIAQFPCEKRDESRLMVIDRETDTVSHKIFRDITSFLNAGDTLVINTSKVLPVRLYGNKINEKGGSGASVEFILIKQDAADSDVWETMVRPGKRLKNGCRVVFGEGLLHGEVLRENDGGTRLVRYTYDKNVGFHAMLDKIGQMPLPPYIRESLDDKNRYQTVYADEAGSCAAPTAGFHFTDELIEKIKKMGVNIAPVVLHVGIGTFRPVKSDQITGHKMHSEYYSIPPQTADIIHKTKAAGKRVIAVGTTSCRTLESASDENGKLTRLCGDTDIFIYPGYQFKATDALITNFHLPQSTLIMLVSAFYDRKKILAAYESAKENNYRFFSFGDAMFLM